MFQDKWSSKNAEFSGLQGNFKLYTIYKDSISTKDDETVLFDQVWSNHYDLFETLSDGKYLPNTFYAKNQGYKEDKYLDAFIGNSDTKTCPISAPLLMYFDYSEANPIKNQEVKGLSDVIFTVNGSSDLEKARTLKNCWGHTDIFGEVK